MLRRIVLPDLPPLPPLRDGGPPERLEELAGWSSARLEQLVRRLGLLALAACLARTPELAEALLARLPPADAAAVREALRAGPLPLPALPRLGESLPVGDVVQRLGAELLGSGLPPELGRSIAWLLPRPLGVALLTAPARLEGQLLLALVRRAEAAP
jgi:hypothetical protein